MHCIYPLLTGGRLYRARFRLKRVQRRESWQNLPDLYLT